MKSPLKSWTLWFGVLQIAYGAVGLWFDLIDPQAGMTLIFTGMGTVGLRIKTTQPISSKVLDVPVEK